MSRIRSLADELRERIRSEERNPSPEGEEETSVLPSAKETTGQSLESISGSGGIKGGKELEILLEAIRKHELSGKEKLLLRLDASTVYLLKQIKIAAGIDMTQFVSFCLKDFLRRHPALKKYIKNSLKNLDL